ncbi:MAG: protein kinase domain-containing protein [Steroidobacteraceae bacterium]
MTLPTWGHVKDLLHQALALAPESRAKFLDEVCASDATLRAELDSLLSVGDGLSAEFLQSPPAYKFGADGVGLGVPGLAEGQLFEQRFRLIRKLGEGGMGQVWLAEQTAPVRRPVALKLIKAGMYDETVVHRFQAERQSLAIMDHPAIAKVFDAGITPQGQPYFVMEYVPGLPITEYCDQRKLPVRERIELLMQACDGVQHAHQKAIIHRDLKPANILVVEVDGKPVPRIIDFGLAKAVTLEAADQTLFTRFGQFMGTPGYMSPEQVDPNIQDIDTRTDVYSLGVVLYVLLTGLQPFETKRRQRPALDEWLRQLREQEPPTPSAKLSTDLEISIETAEARNTEPKQLVSQLRGDLDWITMKALERERERRYGTPSELAADLRRYLNDEPVLARPASAGYQIRKFVRRHRFAAAFVGMVTLLSVVASAAALIAIKQKREAQHQTAETLKAQGRLLTQAAAQRLKDLDVAGAQDIILEVLANPIFAHARSAAAIGIFQEIRASDAQLVVLSGHSAPLPSAAYSPDGTRIVTASNDNTARIWDAHTGAQLAVLSGHGDHVESAAYSPDGTRIITASRDRTARIWDAHSGKQLALLSGHDHIYTAAYSPDGTRIITASHDNAAHIWDARTGTELAVLLGHGNNVYSAAYSPDGARIVTASADKTARIWDAHTGAPLAVLLGHGDGLSSAAYSPDSMRIVTASADKTARIWDAHTGAQLAVLLGHGGALVSAAYSPDGTRVVTASYDNTARIWDARAGTKLAVLSGHVNTVTAAAYSPDGTRVVTASYDNTARIWDARLNTQLAQLSGHDKPVRAVAYSPDGTRVVTASNDKTVRTWDAHTGGQLVVALGHGDPVRAVAYSPDGTRIVTASEDKTARIWDARSGALLAVLLGHISGVYFAAYSPDGTRIVTASDDKTVRIWDAHLGKQLALLSGHGDFVLSAAYSPDGTRIVSASADKTARIWDASSGKQLAVLSGHGATVDSAAYSPDGTRIVTASDDKTARIWDAHTGALLSMLSGHGDAVDSAVYSPDGTRIVTASDDKTARIWDAHTGAQLAVLLGHGDAVGSAAYSPDGARIVTASFDKTARIWDARVPASIDAQIIWATSAETDPLSDVDRKELGLPLDSRARTWPTKASACDQATAAFYDPERLAPGASQANINVDIATSSCSAQIVESGHTARLDYQMGRALLAKGDVNGAKRQFELAVSNGYRVASIDLADLLVSVAASVPDPERAATLYEMAWQDGVHIAAFELGQLYEYGIRDAEAAATKLPKQDVRQAWSWYQKGADVGEPNALARFAERDENNALTAKDESKRNAQLLQAFSFYAEAAERAHRDDWPDDAWIHWRYRRASLARLLALEGHDAAGGGCVRCNTRQRESALHWRC